MKYKKFDSISDIDRKKLQHILAALIVLQTHIYNSEKQQTTEIRYLGH